MAIDYQAEYNAILAVQYLFPTSVSYGQYSALLRPLIIEAETRAIAGDADAIAFLTSNRYFVKNTDGIAHTLNYNGFPWVFAAGKSYSMQLDEASHFIGQGTEQGIGIVNDPAGASYLGGNGIVRFFFF